MTVARQWWRGGKSLGPEVWLYICVWTIFFDWGFWEGRGWAVRTVVKVMSYLW